MEQGDQHWSLVGRLSQHHVFFSALCVQTEQVC